MHEPDAHAQGLDLGDEQRRQIGAGNGAHAAHHHHHEGIGDGAQIESEAGRLARQLHRAAHARQQGSQREHAGKEPGLVDAQGAEHFAVLRGGADQRAPARARQEQPQQRQHDGAHDDQENVVAGKVAAEKGDGALHARRAPAQQVRRAAQPQHRVVDDQHQCESGQQLEQFGCLIDAPQQHDFDRGAQQAGEERGQRHAAPVAPGPRSGELFRQRIGQVDAHHEKGTVGEIQYTRDPEDQREADRDQE